MKIDVEWILLILLAASAGICLLCGLSLLAIAVGVLNVWIQ